MIHPSFSRKDNSPCLSGEDNLRLSKPCHNEGFTHERYLFFLIKTEACRHLADARL